MQVYGILKYNPVHHSSSFGLLMINIPIISSFYIVFSIFVYE